MLSQDSLRQSGVPFARAVYKKVGPFTFECSFFRSFLQDIIESLRRSNEAFKKGCLRFQYIR